MDTNTADLKNLSFEQAYAELLETVEKLEAGNLPLAETITLYQRGVLLARHCDEHLTAAELSLQQLAPSGELEPFEA